MPANRLAIELRYEMKVRVMKTVSEPHCANKLSTRTRRAAVNPNQPRRSITSRPSTWPRP
jgi:hypothetical protein